MLPVFKKPITSVVLPKELKERALEQLRGAFRQSFRKRLELLSEGLDLPFDDETCEKAVKIRNKLVHEGTYS